MPEQKKVLLTLEVCLEVWYWLAILLVGLLLELQSCILDLENQPLKQFLHFLALTSELHDTENIFGLLISCFILSYMLQISSSSPAAIFGSVLHSCKWGMEEGLWGSNYSKWIFCIWSSTFTCCGSFNFWGLSWLPGTFAVFLLCQLVQRGTFFLIKVEFDLLGSIERIIVFSYA